MFYQQEEGYLQLLQDVVNNGCKKSIYGHPDKHIYSVFGRAIRFDLSKGFPCLTTRYAFYRGGFEELLWFIRGTNNITELINSNVNYWNEWAWKYYQQEKKKNNYTFHNYLSNDLTKEEFFSYLKEYNVPFIIPLHYSNGTNWQYNFYYDCRSLNQSHWVIDQIKKNPERKSYLVSYWNPCQVYHMADESDNESVMLPACGWHYQVVINDGKLNLQVGFRSWDLICGAPVNIAQYALLAHMYAHVLNYSVGDLVIFATDAHIYSDHLEIVSEILENKPLQFPNLKIEDRNQKYLEDFKISDFKVENYEFHLNLKANVTVVGGYNK